MTHSNDSTDAAGVPTIIEIPIDYPMTRPVMAVFAISIVAVFAISVLLAWLVSLGSNYVLVSMVVLLIWMLTWGAWSRHHAAHVVAQSCGGSAPLDLRKTSMEILRRSKYIQSMAALHSFVELLASRDHRSTVIRICQPANAGEIRPLLVPFEPQPLDETDRTFQDIIAGEDDAAEQRSKLEDPTMNKIKRNIHLKGGWLITAIFGVNVAIHGWFAYQAGRVTPEFALWSTVFFVTLFAPVGSALSSPRQMLAVPGGLLYRRACRKTGKWEVHLFDRRKSVLCAYQAGKRQWVIAVADGERRETVFGTRREIEFALRAWLSPLEPPDRDRLDDLA